MQTHRYQFRWVIQLKTAARIALPMLIAVAVCGCVQRRLTIRSNPPGARVYVGDEEVGTTPVSTDFVYYGTRKIRLVKPGFETLVVNQPVPAPWYQIPPLDFVSENLVPGEIRDERVVTYELVPSQPVVQSQFLARGEQMRAANGGYQAAVITPAIAPATAPIVPTPGVVPPQYPLPEPVTPGPVNGSPAGQSLPIFAPPGGGPAR